MTHDFPSGAAHRRLRLLQPGPHVHLAVHRRSGREVWLGFLSLARPAVEPTQTEMAMGGKRAHALFLSESHGLPVGGFGFFGIHGIAMRGDLAQSPEIPRLVSPPLVVASEIERLSG